jgi:DNA modification methylase
MGPHDRPEAPPETRQGAPQGGGAVTHHLHLGDCLTVLQALPDASVDSVVTDPPYGLRFMGKRWDYDVPTVEVWEQCLRVLRPGGHLLAFAGTRTQHRMAVRIEDAGFEIRDMIAWVYGSGFPKSLDVSKALDKAAGVEREVVGSRVADDIRGGNMHAANRGERHVIDITAPATPEAQQWAGWGTALKPALEPITMARKPLQGTVAANVLEHGTGALNVDGCRIPGGEQPRACRAPGWDSVNKANAAAGYRPGEYQQGEAEYRPSPAGRWPANLIHDGSEEVVGLFPDTSSGGFREGMTQHQRTSNVAKGAEGEPVREAREPDTGSAARFFYCAKASKRDRDEGLEGFAQHAVYTEANPQPDRDNRAQTTRANTHPTVKPTDLMRYLCRLVTPPGGIVLDPFMGSGSTGKAALLEGFGFVGIEREEASYTIAAARLARASAAGHQLGLGL